MRQVMKAAWRLPAAPGEARMEKEAQALEKDHPSAAASLREALAEMYLPALTEGWHEDNRHHSRVTP